MQDQLASTSERLALARQLGSFASGPPRYLRSRLWARRRRLDAVLAGHIREAG
jgi:hypothetical protein